MKGSAPIANRIKGALPRALFCDLKRPDCSEGQLWQAAMDGEFTLLFVVLNLPRHFARNDGNTNCDGVADFRISVLDLAPLVQGDLLP